MKIARILVAVMILGILITGAVGCQDPRDVKGKELEKVYNKLGDTYFNAIYWTQFAGIYGSDDPAYEAINATFAGWKLDIQDAGDAYDNMINLEVEEMDQYIADWTAIIDEMQKLIDEYEIVTTGEDEAEEEDESTEAE